MGEGAGDDVAGVVFDRLTLVMINSPKVWSRVKRFTPGTRAA